MDEGKAGGGRGGFHGRLRIPLPKRVLVMLLMRVKMTKLRRGGCKGEGHGHGM
jgi:hypothetical protein